MTNSKCSLPKRSNVWMPLEMKLNGITECMDYDDKSTVIDNNTIEYTRQLYEQMGIRIMSNLDKLFYSVELPEGWKIKETNSPLWNVVLDEKNRERIAVYCSKNQYTGTKTYSELVCRYSYLVCPFDDYKSDISQDERNVMAWYLYFTDCGEKIMKLQTMTAGLGCEFNLGESHLIPTTLNELGTDFLDKNYPDWRNPLTYWD